MLQKLQSKNQMGSRIQNLCRSMLKYATVVKFNYTLPKGGQTNQNAEAVFHSNNYRKLKQLDLSLFSKDARVGQLLK